MFWVGASMVEALVGTGQAARAAEIQANLANTAPETWMPQSLQEQLDKLKAMLATVPEVAGSRRVVDRPHPVEADPGRPGPVSLPVPALLDQECPQSKSSVRPQIRRYAR
jgi:hypothetical protein